MLRAGKTLTIPVASKTSDGTAVIGVQVQVQYKFPFSVRISTSCYLAGAAFTTFSGV